MASSFVIAHRRWPGSDIRVDYPQAFVIMPFSQPWSDPVYRQMIRPAVEAAGLACVRGDNPVRVGDLMQTVWDPILVSGVMIAEVSALNPNVFYELGLAHALGKDTFILKQKGSTVPADFGGAALLQVRPERSGRGPGPVAGRTRPVGSGQPRAGRQGAVWELNADKVSVGAQR